MGARPGTRRPHHRSLDLRTVSTPQRLGFFWVPRRWLFHQYGGARWFHGAFRNSACFNALAKFAQPLTQTDLVERSERELHEGPKLPLKACEHGGQCLSAFPCLTTQLFGIGIAPIRPMRERLTDRRIAQCEYEIEGWRISSRKLGPGLIEGWRISSRKLGPGLWMQTELSRKLSIKFILPRLCCSPLCLGKFSRGQCIGSAARASAVS